MSLTVAISTHGGYARYLAFAAATAAHFADEVVVYDDGGECADVELPDGVRYVPMTKTGFCTAARRRAIEEARCAHLLHLDGDDWMVARPEPEGADWYFSDMVTSTGMMWTYAGRDNTVQGAWRFLHEERDTPLCSKSVWRVDWLRENGLSWYEWPSTSYAEDCRTEIEYLLREPYILYRQLKPFYGYRIHDEQDSHDALRRAAFKHDLDSYLRGL